MISAITFFEFRMYFVPGAAFLLAGWWNLHLSGLKIDSLSAGVTESVVFILTAYLIGHAIQTLAHGFRFFGVQVGLEKLLFAIYGRGRLPSERALLDGSSILNPSLRNEITDCLRKSGEIKSETIGFEDGQCLFLKLLYRNAKPELSEIKVAESLYQMHRGIFSAFVILLVIGCVLLVASKFFQSAPSVSIVALAIDFLGVLIFSYRCRGAGEGLARRVFMSVLNQTP